MDRNRILELTADMTLEEKAMQMTQLSPDMFYHRCPSNLTGPLREWRFEDEQLQEIGSVLGQIGRAHV